MSENKRMSKKIKYEISHQMEQLHWESIEIPSMTSGLLIQADMPEICRCMAFILVKDPEGTIRLQKLLGHGEQKLGIGLTTKETSIGGVPGNIQAGAWQIGIGIFTEYVAQVLGENVENLCLTITEVCEKDLETTAGKEIIQEKISDPILGNCWVKEGLHISAELYDWQKVYNEETRWYKGDFHTHTHLSDGKETITNAMKKAEDMNMDFYVPTEHNLIHTGWCNTSLCIPGVEITTDFGHMNLFGITEFPERILDIVAENGNKGRVSGYVNEIISEAKEKEWLTSINHPFLTIWSWRYEETLLDGVDCLEIINDPTYPDAAHANDKAVHFLDELWNDGYRIYGVGGSDSHNLIEERYEGATLPSIVGDPGTYVFCKKLTPKNLMKNVKKGHICVTRFIQVEPYIMADGKPYLPGDNLGEAKEIVYNAVIRDAKEKPKIYLINNGMKAELSVKKNTDGTYEIQEHILLNHREWQWIRLEIRNQSGELLGYVNPVYKGHKEPTYKTFGEIADKLNESNKKLG